MSKELDAKRAAYNKLGTEVRALEDKEKCEVLYPEAKKLEGTYWKYRNTDGGGDEEEKYWWLYRRIVTVSPDGNLYTDDFEIDRRGHLDVRPRWPHPYLYFELPPRGWIPSTEKEWTEALAKARAMLDALGQVRP